jgi:hypothetical protein
MIFDHRCHIVQRSTTLAAVAAEAYGQGTGPAQDFIRVNQPLAGGDGRLEVGQVLFLNDGMRYPDESRWIRELQLVNQMMLRSFDPPDRAFVASAYGLLESTGCEPFQLQCGPQSTSLGLRDVLTVGSTLSTAIHHQVRLLGDQMRRFENEWVTTIRRGAEKNRPSAALQARKDLFRRGLDAPVARFVRRIALGSAMVTPANPLAGIAHRRQIRAITVRNASRIELLRPHFETIGKRAKLLRNAGVAFIALDAVLTYATVQEFCATSDSASCTQQTYRQTGGFIGRVGGGAVGAGVGYGACNLVLGAPTAGTSLLWCGIIVGGVGYAGSEAVGGLMERGGGWLYRQQFKIPQ